MSQVSTGAYVVMKTDISISPSFKEGKIEVLWLKTLSEICILVLGKTFKSVPKVKSS